MNRSLYNPDILRLAVSIPFEELLEDAAAVVVRRVSPVCGSEVTASLLLDSSGRVARFGQHVEACALGQASAAVLGRHVIGAGAKDIRRAHDQLRDWLQGGPLADELAEGWPEIRMLAPAQGYPGRHASILLAFDAAASAAEKAQGAICRSR